MKTKKSILTIVAVLLTGMFAFAQPGSRPEDDRHEKIMAKRVAVITERLNLSVVEAQIFWPLFNECENKRKVIADQRRDAMDKIREPNNKLTDKEMEEVAKNLFEADEKELALRKEYFLKYREILPLKKVLELYNTEEHFKRELIKELKGPRPEGKHRPPPQEY